MTHTITLVSDVYVSKTEALRALSELLGIPVNDKDPSNAVLDLDDGVVLSIEVPKFGEDLPLTLDLTGQDRKSVERVARGVITSVRDSISWSLLNVTNLLNTSRKEIY